MPIDTILLFVVALLLLFVVALLIMTLRRPQVTGVQIGIDPHLEEQITRITEKVVHSVDVSAVLEMIVQIEEFSDEDRARLESYPETVRAACWQHYITGLGRDLEQAQNQLSETHQASSYDFVFNSKAQAINAAQAHVDAIRAKLDAAIKASAQSVGMRAV